MDQTPRLSLPLIVSGQAQKHITHNEALATLDRLVQPVVESRTLETPPLTPLAGEAWLVPAGATGAWSGHSAELASWDGTAWRFDDPAKGWQAIDRSEDSLLIFDGASWQVLASLSSALTRFGINATADSTNRLAVSGPATLFTHNGAGHQLKLNKAAAADTASLLYQTNWSGRAEMGLAGDDHWRLRVSPDGTNWLDAMIVNATTGGIRIAGTLRPTGDNTTSLGTSGARWSTIWAATGTITTSDRRQKTDIAPSDLGLDFIEALRPVRFRWNDGVRTHYGLLAQDVFDVLDGRDFAGHIISEPENPESQQGLRYDSFIAPLIVAVQELARRVEALEARS